MMGAEAKPFASMAVWIPVHPYASSSDTSDEENTSNPLPP